MLVDIVTIFPGFFASPLATGLLGKAGERGLVEVRLHDLRDWATDRHRSVDDAPFGGGAGMVLLPAPWFDALDALEAQGPARVVLLARRPATSTTGSPAAGAEPRLICAAAYEGIDERASAPGQTRSCRSATRPGGGRQPPGVVLAAVARSFPGEGNADSAPTSR